MKNQLQEKEVDTHLCFSSYHMDALPAVTDIFRKVHFVKIDTWAENFTVQLYYV